MNGVNADILVSPRNTNILIPPACFIALCKGEDAEMFEMCTAVMTGYEYVKYWFHDKYSNVFACLGNTIEDCRKAKDEWLYELNTLPYEEWECVV